MILIAINKGIQVNTISLKLISLKPIHRIDISSKLVLLSTSWTKLDWTGPMGSTQFDLKIFKSQFGSVWLDLSSWWDQTDEVDEFDGQVDGTDGKSMGLILTTPSVWLGGPSRSVRFNFGFKSDRTEPLITLVKTLLHQKSILPNCHFIKMNISLNGLFHQKFISLKFTLLITISLKDFSPN